MLPKAAGAFTFLGLVAAVHSAAADDVQPPPPPPAAAPAPSAPAGSPPPSATLPPDSPDTALPHELPPDTWSDPAHTPRAIPSEWHFSSYGYLRAPLRIGVGQRPSCPAGATTPTQVMIPSGVGGQPYAGQYCALPDQSRTTFHSPYLPDDQYLAWTFDRSWEKAWAELYLSYGTNHVTGTIGLMAYDFTETSFIGGTANPAQAGIGQAWVTVTPTVPVEGVRMDWKIGAFSEKYGMARITDGGAYDTYMFGRTYQMGEALTGRV